jgi:hypothetical protein
MSPFFSYSGRGGSHRGRGRGRGRSGRGAVGRGRGRSTRLPYVRSGIGGTPYSGREISLDRRVNINKHQWVRSPGSAEEKDGIKNDERPESTSKNIPGISTVVGTDKVVTGSDSKKEKDEALPFPEYSHPIMKKNKQHKLILSSKTKTRSVASAGISGDSLSGKEQESRHPATQGQTLTREGKNKLVSLTTSNTANATKKKKDPSTNNGFRGRQNNTSSIGGAINRRTKLAPPSTVLRSTAKRVKLSVQPCSKMKEEDTIACNKLKEDSDCNSKSKPTEKLSDFAYREISRVRQRPIISRHNLHWSKQSNNESCKTSLPSPSFTGNPNKGPKSKNIGLVRIQPDETNTPVCPTFLRGLHCQNQFCRKRHDIPKEYAMPVCSFFQRHGQCLRGDTCVFRHVKLNANAMVCPSFAVLGFCEDEKCTMQHVHGHKGANGVSANNTCTIATEESPSRFRRKPNNVYHRNKSTSGGRAKDT